MGNNRSDVLAVDVRVSVRHEGKCMGGPWHGQQRVGFSEEMPVTELIGNPVQGGAWNVDGYYKHDGRGVWVWFGPSIKPL